MCPDPEHYAAASARDGGSCRYAIVYCRQNRFGDGPDRQFWGRYFMGLCAVWTTPARPLGYAKMSIEMEYGSPSLAKTTHVLTHNPGASVL